VDGVMERALSLGGVPAEELFEMAACVEQSGFDFYARLTSRTTDQRVKNELRFLRDEAALHKSWFLAQLRAGGNAPGGGLSAALQENLEQEFLEPVEKAFASSAKTDTDTVLRLGSELARKSIGLYAAMKGLVPAEQRAELGRIIAAEEAHLLRLDLLRASPERGLARTD
jgi:rubrerythrin